MSSASGWAAGLCTLYTCPLCPSPCLPALTHVLRSLVSSFPPPPNPVQAATTSSSVSRQACVAGHGQGSPSSPRTRCCQRCKRQHLQALQPSALALAHPLPPHPTPPSPTCALCPPLPPPAGLFDYLQRWHPGSTVVGFLGGPAGVMKNQFKLLTEQELVSPAGWLAGEAGGSRDGGEGQSASTPGLPRLSRLAETLLRPEATPAAAAAAAAAAAS